MRNIRIQKLKITMTKNQILSSLALSAMSMIAQPAFADGIYLGGSVGNSDVNVSGSSESLTGTKIFGGFKFAPNWAIEAGYSDLGTYEAPNQAGSISGTSAFIDVVGLLPISEKLSFIARLGYASTEVSVKVSGSGVSVNQSEDGTKYGLGLEYAINNNLSIRGEWEQYSGKFSTLKLTADVISFGLLYKF